ncbi:hypothetical protein [Methanococcoides sp. FTZ1]|uniref:hypothetical protein n=1 Tax=Methanococcoides sp. FTZ1 TaxID=3439061 RepID=UPI003F84994E
MEDEDLIHRINDLEKRIGAIEENDKDYEDGSFISATLNIVNFKKLIETLFFNQPYFKPTNKLVDAIVLFIFLSLIFKWTDVLAISWNPATTTLVIIFLAICGEFAGANIPTLKKYVSRDESQKKLLNGISSMTDNEAIKEIRRRTLSSKCVNYFICSLAEADIYSTRFTYELFESQTLTNENLDRLFRYEIIINIHPDVVKRVLFLKSGDLKPWHIASVYDNFQNHKDVMKTLIATQPYSDFLLDKYPDNQELQNYYEKYQQNKEHLDRTLKTFTWDKISKVILFLAYTTFFAITAVWSVYIHTTQNTWPNLESFIAIIIVSGIAVALVVILPLKWIYKTRIRGYYYNRFLKNVMK